MEQHLPPQVAPLSRPHRQPPHDAVDVAHGSRIRLVSIRMALMHGANYNDPGPWSPAPYDLRRFQR